MVLNIPRVSDHTLIGHSSSPSSSQLRMAPVLRAESETLMAVVWLLAGGQGFEVPCTLSSQDKCFLVGIDYLSLGFA